MTLDDTTRRTLSRYLTDIRQLPNESAKTHRFSSLVTELFPGSTAPTEFAAGPAITAAAQIALDHDKCESATKFNPTPN